MKKINSQNFCKLLALIIGSLAILSSVITTPSKTVHATSVCDTILASKEEWKIPLNDVSKYYDFQRNPRFDFQTLISFQKDVPTNSNYMIVKKSVTKDNIDAILNIPVVATDKYDFLNDIKEIYIDVQDTLGSQCPGLNNNYSNGSRTEGEIITSITKLIDDAITEDKSGKSTSIAITAEETVVKGKSTNIHFVLSNFANGDKYVLYISNLKDGCTTDTEQARCWDTKASGQISTGIKNVDYSWDTLESGTVAGVHTIRAKVFKSDGTLRESSEKTIVVCETADKCTAETTPVEEEKPQDTYVNAQDIKGLAKLKAGVSSVQNVLDSLVNNWFPLVIVVLAFIAIIVGGFFYITSGGDPKGAEKGKKTILYSIIGLVLASLSYIIIMTVIAELKNAGILAK